MTVVEKLSVCEGVWGEKLATIVSLDLVSRNTVRCTKEYTLAYIPELNEWRGDVIAYGEWVDIDRAEIANLRAKYYLDALVNLN